MGLPLKFIAAVVGANAKEFAEGWFEGRMRYNSANDKTVISGSGFKPGTVAFAASQAGVAFYVGREG